ncbi:hypothetical protein [Cryobacterium shii]|uniref:Uncharacterized protein n=1 Tax=Cryobacterium shii TaxID=1259235 RepID=A0AAQ2C714_9MICO|nr:hypothetical protein [Cryobacterium shii]TFC48924.1 hypothetical protein E3O49_06860 [Cryobacterium shii]
MILAFYGALIGQSLTGLGIAPSTRTRNTLGIGAQFLSGTMLVFIILSIVACFDDPAQTPRLFGIIVVGGTLILLGAGTGAFVFGTRSERARFAEQEIRAAQTAQDKLRPSIKPSSAWWSLSATTIALCILPTALLGILRALGLDLGPWVTFSAVYSILSLIAVSLLLLFTYGLLVGRTSRGSAIASWLGVLGYAGFFIWLGIQLATTGAQEMAVPGWAVVGAVLLAGLTSWLPVARGRGPVRHRWTYGAALTGLANQRLTEYITKRNDLLVELGRSEADQK